MCISEGMCWNPRAKNTTYAEASLQEPENKDRVSCYLQNSGRKKILANSHHAHSELCCEKGLINRWSKYDQEKECSWMHIDPDFADLHPAYPKTKHTITRQETI